MSIQHLVRTGLSSVVIALIAAPAFSHGGQYQGPGDIVPPGTKPRGRPGTGGGPTTPGPRGPGVPGGGRTTTGGRGSGPSLPGGIGGNSPITGTRGGTLVPSLAQWQFWWEFNKWPYLRLKDAIFQQVMTGSDDFVLGRGYKSDGKMNLAPSEADIIRMRTALQGALEDPSSNRDIVSACMVALAKIGRDAAMLPALKKFLSSHNQEMRETAALAMGIAGLDEATQDLAALASDAPAGRKLCKRQEVDFRTRSFACYGLGLIAWGNKEHAIKARVFATMTEILDSQLRTRNDVRVAALNAIRLLRPNAEAAEGKQLLTNAIDYLTRYLDRKGEYDQVRAHAYTAISRLVKGSGMHAPKLVARVAKTLGQRRRTWIHQSAALALGEMAKPTDDAANEALRRYLAKGRNEQARYFAAIALGRIGGDKNRDVLLQRLNRAQTPTLQRPWLAFGLAILDHAARERDTTKSIDMTAADAIERHFRKTRNPIFAAGFAVALGIMRHKDAGNAIAERMIDYKNQDEACGYLALSLGLMRYTNAVRDIESIVERATRREVTLTQGATALGLLGDKTIVRSMVHLLKQRGTVAVLSSVSRALGFIGDKTSVDPLIDTLQDKKLKNLPRAFAAVALGLVGDKEDLPWNTKLSVDLNYRANVETLTTRAGTGVLDIL